MNYYELLEIREDASPDVIKMAYKALCRRYHPDVYTGDPTEANEVRAQLNEAYEVLSDPDKRAIYDASLGISDRDAIYQTATEKEYQPAETPEDEPGMSWFSFYVNFALVVGAIRGCVSFVCNLANGDVQALFSYGGPITLLAIITLVCDILGTSLLVYLAIALRNFSSKRAYYGNMLLLALYPALGVGSFLWSDEEIFFLVAAFIFSLLNIIYFQKRAFLYNVKDSFTAKNFLKMMICTIIASGAILVSIHALAGDFSGLAQPAQDVQTQQEQDDMTATLEDYVNSNDEVKESLRQVSDSNEGMTVEVKGNTVIYTYQYDETYDADVMEQMADQFEPYMDSAASTFENIASTLEEESEIDGVTVRVVYLNGDGTEIYSGEYDAE